MLSYSVCVEICCWVLLLWRLRPVRERMGLVARNDLLLPKGFAPEAVFIRELLPFSAVNH